MKTYKEFVSEAYLDEGIRTAVAGAALSAAVAAHGGMGKKIEKPTPSSQQSTTTTQVQKSDSGSNSTWAKAHPNLAAKEASTKKPTAVKDQLSSIRDMIARSKARQNNEEFEYVNETSLNRVRSKSQKGGMAIMSAQRGDKSKKENKARSKQLEKDIRGAGLPGPTKVSGRYTENPGTAQEKKVGEKSHVISSGKMGKKKFKKAVTKLGKKYNQDSVLIQKKPKGGAQLVGTNKSWPGEGKRVKVGKMNPGKTGEFDTKVKNKTFTYEEYEN